MMNGLSSPCFFVFIFINDIYGISGSMNQHPRQAMKLRADKENQDNCYNFFLESTGVNDVDIA